MDMVTYVMMAFAVALLAGFTGAMPVPALRRRHPGSAARPAADEKLTAWWSSAIDGIERSLPPEILEALAKADHLDIPGEAVEHSSEQASPPSGANTTNGFSRASDQGPGVSATTRGKVLDEIVDSLMQGTQFIALTGSHGAGKTGMAVAIREELCRRSVSVRWVDGGGGSGIPLRVIMSRVLGKPETDIGADDIEELFDAMTEREADRERLALIIDDAECLLPDAIGYLRLVASVAMDRMPQIVFVGDPLFWEVAARTAGFEKLITARFELALASQEEARADLQGSIHAPGAAKSSVRQSDGLIGPLVALLAALWATAAKMHHRQTPEGHLDTDIRASRPDDSAARQEHASGSAVGLRAEWDLAGNNLHWGSDIARIAGVAVMVVGVIAMPAHRFATLGVAPLSPEEQQTSRGQPLAGHSASTIAIRLPSATQAPAGILVPGSSAQLVSASAVEPDVFEPLSLPDRKMGYGGIGLHRQAAKVKTAQKQPPFTGYATGSTNGTWLFPANINSGANS
jgi:type II secretory pathway predicted ATPase ExeA